MRSVTFWHNEGIKSLLMIKQTGFFEVCRIFATGFSFTQTHAPTPYVARDPRPLKRRSLCCLPVMFDYGTFGVVEHLENARLFKVAW